MNLKLKALAAALAVVVTAPVFATAIPTTASGDGGLLLSAWDPSANGGVGLSYTLNLGMTESTFNGNTNYSFAPDANMTSFLSQVTAGNVLWNVVAGDAVGGVAGGKLHYYVTGLVAPVTSTTSTNTTPSNSQLGKATAIDTYINLVNNDLASSNSVVHASLGSGDSEYAGSGSFGDRLAGQVPYSNIGNLGASLLFSQFSSNGTSNLTKALVSPFAGNWSLSGNGGLTYGVSTVPVPAAAWLFASGLVGMIGVARRKNGNA